MSDMKDGGPGQAPGVPDQAMGLDFPSIAGLQQRLKDQKGNIFGLTSILMKMEEENETLLQETEALKKHHQEKEQVLSDVKEALKKHHQEREQVLSDVKAGLQQRLKDKEGVISGLLSSNMKLELENQTLHLKNASFKKQLLDKDTVIDDLRKQLQKRELMINQLQEQHLNNTHLLGPQGTIKASEMKREATSFMDSSRSMMVPATFVQTCNYHRDASEASTVIQKLAELSIQSGGDVKSSSSLDPLTGAAKSSPGSKAEKSQISDKENTTAESYISDADYQTSEKKR